MTTSSKLPPPPDNLRHRILGMIVAAPLLLPITGMSRQSRPLTRPIPSSGESLPLVGLGSWITFNVGNDASHEMPVQKSCVAFFRLAAA